MYPHVSNTPTLVRLFALDTSFRIQSVEAANRRSLHRTSEDTQTTKPSNHQKQPQNCPPLDSPKCKSPELAGLGYALGGYLSNFRLVHENYCRQRGGPNGATLPTTSTTLHTRSTPIVYRPLSYITPPLLTPDMYSTFGPHNSAEGPICPILPLLVLTRTYAIKEE